MLIQIKKHCWVLLLHFLNKTKQSLLVLLHMIYLSIIYLSFIYLHVLTMKLTSGFPDTAANYLIRSPMGYIKMLPIVTICCSFLVNSCRCCLSPEFYFDTAGLLPNRFMRVPRLSVAAQVGVLLFQQLLPLTHSAPGWSAPRHLGRVYCYSPFG